MVFCFCFENWNKLFVIPITILFYEWNFASLLQIYRHFYGKYSDVGKKEFPLRQLLVSEFSLCGTESCEYLSTTTTIITSSSLGPTVIYPTHPNHIQLFSFLPPLDHTQNSWCRSTTDVKQLSPAISWNSLRTPAFLSNILQPKIYFSLNNSKRPLPRPFTRKYPNVLRHWLKRWFRNLMTYNLCKLIETAALAYDQFYAHWSDRV